MLQNRKSQLIIDCYVSQDCQSEKVLRKNIAAAFEKDNVKAEVNFHRINNDEAASLGLSGSPSVFINGKELQPLGTTGFS